MFKSILIAAALAIGLGASSSASALKFGSFGGLGSSSSCSDTSTTGCWCKCMTFGDALENCDVTSFITPDGDVCAYCSGDDCGNDFSGFGRWSFIP